MGRHCTHFTDTQLWQCYCRVSDAHYNFTQLNSVSSSQIHRVSISTVLQMHHLECLSLECAQDTGRHGPHLQCVLHCEQHEQHRCDMERRQHKKHFNQKC